jgi:UDP-3-O-[3-hydroxymyristoyl] N-acetylglucosamine deacetylase
LIVQGIGGHSGQNVTLDIQASTQPGIWFVLPQGRIRAHVDHVISTNMCTTIKQGEAYVSTIEHFLSACSALGIHQLNVTVIGGNEIPLMDGSALGFYEALKSVILGKGDTGALDRGPIHYNDTPSSYLNSEHHKSNVLNGSSVCGASHLAENDVSIKVENERGWIEFTPHDEMIFNVRVDAPFPKQHFIFNATKDNYQKEIAPARTFGFYKDGERLKQQGMALGSDFTNTIVLSDEGEVLNPEGLRYPEELARHKILDAIGDLALGEMPMTGYYRAVNPGHALNVDLLRRIKALTPTSL